jgi:cytochrome c biogenesis protein CcmG, thiol:disulfide interchange protein DsbE
VSSTAPRRFETAPLSQPNPWVARGVALAVALVVLSLIGLMIWGIGKRNAGTVGEARIQPRPAPEIALPRFDGGSFSLADARGKPVLINFWASWCIPCEEEARVLERASRLYRDRVVFVGVNVQDTDQNARTFLQRYGVTYANVRDASGAVLVEYGMGGVPESYFVDAEGRLVRKWQGPLDDARLRTFLDDLVG